MLEIRKFKAEDAEVLCPDASDDVVRNSPPEVWRAWAKFNETAGAALTGFCRGEMVAAAGIRIVRNGIGWPWFIIRRGMSKHKIEIFRSTKKMLGILIGEFGIKKLRAESRIGFSQSQRWLEHLGFTKQRRKMVGKDFYFYKMEIV